MPTICRSGQFLVAFCRSIRGERDAPAPFAPEGHVTTTWTLPGFGRSGPLSGADLEAVLDGRRQHLFGAAEFLGLASGRRWAARKGTLVLCDRTIEYVTGARGQRNTIFIDDVLAVTVIETWQSRATRTPCLAVTFYTPNGTDGAAWAVRDPRAWQATLDALRARNRLR